MSRSGILFIIAAPSGAGKTSLVHALVNATPNMTVSVSHTTRAKRANETADIDYHFVSHAEFEVKIKENAFLEYAKVFDHYYGTEKSLVEKKLAAGFDVILEIDWQGAMQVRHQLANTVSIFILPPSIEILQHRLENRKQDSAEVVAKRMQQAKEQMQHYVEFDYLVMNNDFSSALSDLQAIVRSAHLQRQQQAHDLQVVLQNLLR